MKPGLRDKMIGIGRNPEERAFISRCLDWLQQAEKGRPVLTGFLNPGQAGLLEQVGGGTDAPRLHQWGGHTQAERRRVLIGAHEAEPNASAFDITVLEAVLSQGEAVPRHRDYLGALLNLGLKRGKIGDVVPCAQGAYLFVADDIAGYVEQNLVRVGRSAVWLSPVDPGAVPAPVPPETKTVSVASLRLDAVISAGFHLSRGESSQLVRQGRAKVNWREQSDPSYAVRVGDVISCRGRGRIVIIDGLGASRKGRTRLVIGIPGD